MAIQTQPKDVQVHIDPYSFLAEIQVLSGNPVQNYNKDTNDYEPDRSLVPCVLMPYISVQDPEGLMNGSQTITGAEWYEGAPKSDGSNRIVDNDDYAISASGKPTYSLTVKKNVDYNSPIELHCIFSITDKRKNTQEKFERSIVLRTSIFDSNNYSLKINRPKAGLTITRSKWCPIVKENGYTQSPLKCTQVKIRLQIPMPLIGGRCLTVQHGVTLRLMSLRCLSPARTQMVPGGKH